MESVDQYLKDRVSLITGGAQSMRLAVARALGAAGSTVILADLDDLTGESGVAQLCAEGIDGAFHRVDVTSGESVSELVSWLKTTYRRIDILVNSTDLMGIGPSETYPEDDWRRLMNVMVDGVFRTSQAIGQVMLDAGRGSIVNIASIGALGGWPQRAAYNAANAAIVNLTEVLGIEWAARGIRVNAVAPGIIRTAAFDDMTCTGAPTEQQFEARIPLGRLGQAEEVANVVRFLASDRASFITGSTLPIDGGWTAWTALPVDLHGPPGPETARSTEEQTLAPHCSLPHFSGQVVGVTGGARGIGLAIARAFAQRGAAVILLDRDSEALESACASFRQSGYEAAGYVADVSDYAALENIFLTIDRQFGRVDVWVNNAGLALHGPSEILLPQEWDRSVDVMLSAPFYCSQLAGRRMLDQRRGSIINIASINAFLVPEGRAAYASSKAGVVQLTRALAVEWAGRGIRVNAVIPSVIRTDMALAQHGGATMEAYIRRTPMGRLGRVEEVAESVVFLASDEASYVTGAALRVDGGWLAYHYLYPAYRGDLDARSAP